MAELPEKPITRQEEYLNAIATGDPTGLPDPITREEVYLDYIAKNGGGGGGTGDVTGVKGNAEQTYRKGKVNLTPANLGIEKATANKLGIVKPDGTTTEVDANGAIKVIGGAGGGGSLENALNVTVSVGGIDAGDTYAKDTKLEKILRDMLDPVMYPTLTAPSATLTATGAKLLEIGATLATTMTVAFNRGSINPAYGTSGYRSGAATGYALNGGESQVENTFSVTVTEAQKTYQASVAYAAGEQPKDSVGDDYSTPLAAGSVNSNTITYEFVNALWANTANIATVAKLALVSKSAKQKDFQFPAQTVANPETFDVPASWTVTAVQVKNDLSGVYEDALAQFTVTDTTHNDAAGNSVAYKRYTFNLGYDTGARTVRLKWS